jgi:HSP20 family protein
MMNAPLRSASVFSELERLQNALDQVFSPAERTGIRNLAGPGFPVLNVGSTPDTIEVMALAPGLDPASLQLTLDRGLLVIAGERPQQGQPGENATAYAQERFAGNFRRVVTLPDEADPAKVDAVYRDGILRITVGKRESSRPRRIEIN